MSKTKRSRGEILEAIKGSYGFVTTIAQKLDVSRTTMYRYIKQYATVREALDDEREATKDFVESALLQQIENGSPASTIFFLKTRCRDRGYGEHQDLRISSEETIGIEIVPPSNYTEPDSEW